MDVGKRIPHASHVVGDSIEIRAAHAESASSASRRDETPSLCNKLFTCERTVCSEMKRRRGDVLGAQMLVEQEQHLEPRAESSESDLIGHRVVAIAVPHLLEQAPGDRPG